VLRDLTKNYGEIPGLLWRLLATQGCMNATHFMAFPLFAVYMANRLGFDPAAIGTVLTVHLGTRQVLPSFIGPIADRFGFRLFMAAGLFLRGAGLIGFAFGTSWPTLAGMAFLIGLGTALYESAVNGVFGRQPNALAARVFVVNNQILNLGVVIGPLVGGLAIAADMRTLFVVGGVLFMLLAVWTATLREVDSVHGERTAISTSVLRVLRNRIFLMFFLVSLPWWFLYTQLFVAFPIHLSRVAGEGAVASIYLVNGAAGFFAMIPAMLLFERIEARKLIRMAYFAAVLLFAAVPLSEGLWWFLAAVAVYTLIESILIPATETMIATLADNGSQATFFGVAALAWFIGGSAGNYVGSWLILESTPTITWLTFAGVALLGFLLAAIFARLQPAAAATRNRPAPASV
jgi:MFS transporter, DHA1 family, multidrug resistance protein